MLALAFALGACTGGDGAADTPTAQQAAAPTATSAPSPTSTPDPLQAPEANGERTLEHVRVLAEDIGPRVSGTPQEVQARDYLRAELESYGYDVTTPVFEFDASVFLPASVEVAGEAISGIALDGSATGTATGQLVPFGIGRPEDAPPRGLDGSIALIQRGELTFQEKAANAVAAGAIGVVVYNNEPGRVAGTLPAGITIPVVGISQEDGERLAASGLLPFTTITILGSTATSYNVVARPSGSATPCDTVTGGHYDSVPVTGGADDNASGTAAVLETARIVAARDLPGVHCFALFGAEEYGLFGSAHFVESLSDAELSALRGMVNLDVVGLPQDLELIGSEDMVNLAGIVASDLGLPSRPSSVPNGAGSDHLSFIRAGVPAVFLYRHDPLIHTPEDAIGRMSVESLAQTAEAAAAILAELTE